MDTHMHSGLTIAFICKGDNHPTVINYYKFGKKYWDDTKTNGSKKGYYFAYYFQKKYVYLHQIIDILQPADRPACMDWDSNRQILCLSEQPKAFTWSDWITGPGLNAPYTPTYFNTQTWSSSYNEMKQHKKFSSFQFIHFKKCLDAPIHSMEDDEIARAEELIRNIKARKAQREAKEKIELLRITKCNEIQVLIEEMEETRKCLIQKQMDYRSGIYDKELV